MTDDGGAAARDLGQARRVLAVASVAVAIVYLDLFIVNIAFPDIRADFTSASVGDLSWVLNAYAIVFAALLVPLGRLADRAGRKRWFVWGMVTFIVASGLCAAAPSVETLVAARVIQAVGAAIVLPTSLALVLVAYPAERRAAAIAIWGAVGGVAAALGPPLGGVLVELDWRWVFIVNLPIGLLALWAALRVLPESRVPGPAPDLVGSALLAIAIGAVTLGLVNSDDWGWTDARVLGGFAAGALLVPAFVVRSARHPVPVVELAIMRVRSFALASAAALAFNAAFAAMLLATILFMVIIWGWTVLHAGLAIVPGPGMAAIVAVMAPLLARKIGRGQTIALGGLLFAAGAISWLLLVEAQPDYVGALLPGTLLTGAGVGLTFPISTDAATSSLPANRYATGAAVLQMARQLGAVLGVAILVAIIGTPLPFDGKEVFEGGFIFMAIAAGIAALFGLALGRGPAPGEEPSLAEPVAEVEPVVGGVA